MASFKVPSLRIPSPKHVLESWSALIAIWAPPLIEYTESLEWPLLIIGATGTGSVLFSSWRTSRTRSWRKSHGLSGGV